ncbi:MAG: ribosome-associated translation inhibitor RaiA [bacterium]
MEIKISARHMDLTPSIVEYIHKKIEKIQKYFTNINLVQIVLGCEKIRQTAQIIVHVAGTTFRAKETSVDMYAALDLIYDNIDMQLKRHKERLKYHHTGKNIPVEILTEEKPMIPIAHRQTMVARVMSLNDAVSLLENSRKKLIVFQDEDTSKLYILGKKREKLELMDVVYE